MLPKALIFVTVLTVISASAGASPAPNYQQGAKLVGTAAVGAAQQGSSVALSADGTTAIVGGFHDGASGTGAAWVYTRSGNVWSQQTKLIGSGPVGTALEGASVAVSADGNTVIIGGNGDNTNVGAAWVFTRNAGLWTQQGAKLVGSGAAGAANQGLSVALSADGNTAIVGGNTDNSNVGAAWVYTRSGGVWSQQGAKLVGSGAVGSARQGLSVALSADGNTAIVGGFADNSNLGAAWVFTRSGGVWTQQGAKLTGVDATAGAQQGFSVALSADGNTAMVAGSGDNSGAGAAFVYTRSGGVWSQQGAKLVGSGPIGGAFQGHSLALSGDGNTAIVGGFADNSNTGAAWVFTRNNGTWTQPGAKLVGTGAAGAASQAISVALSADGYTAIEGGTADNSNAGAAWVFVDPAPGIVTVADVPNDEGGKLTVRWNKSMMDFAPGNPIDAYWIWRQVPTGTSEATPTSTASLTEAGGPAPRPGAIRTSIEAGQVIYWEFVGSQASHGFPGYSYSVPTLSDSTPTSNPNTLIMVEAEQLSTGLYWSSAPDSGYSVDNLPPGTPTPVAAAYQAGATLLHWGVNPESDFSLYRIYKGASAGFTPGPGNLLASQPDTGYADVGPAGSYYKLSAVDIHGNESAFALISPAGTLSANGGGPVAFALDAPASPAHNLGLVISFSLLSGEPARLELVDVSGRTVASREVGSLGPGRHTLDLSTGTRLVPGLYFMRLTQGPHVARARVAVLG
ncbi:MAG TPA: hypothetical protein VFK69_06805 [Candidatus Eisenbacteria bacterium]|nr:hypothetical protein [Candidatus Eisenbacteria bacterium]